MRKTIYFLFFALIFAGCTTSPPVDDWWNHPASFFEQGYAFVGVAKDEDPKIAKEEAYANALNGLVSFLKVRLQSLTEQISKQTKDNNKKTSRKESKHFLETIAQGNVMGVEIKKSTRHTDGTTYCLIIVKNPALFLKFFQEKTIRPSSSTNQKIIDQLIQEEEKRIQKEQKKF